MGNWKAVRYGTDLDTELYNLEEDLYETRNVAAEHPKIIDKANQLFRSARIDTWGFPYGGKFQDYRARDRYQSLESTH
jgi:hypothetical protein